MTARIEGVLAEKGTLAEKSVDQASRAFDGFMTAAQKTTSQADTTVATVQSHAKTMGTKAMGFAEINVRNAFDLARKLVLAKDPQQFLALQSEYVRTQMAAIQEQAKELGSIMQTTAQGMVQVASQRTKTDSQDSDETAGTSHKPQRVGVGLKAFEVEDAAFQPDARATAVLRGIDIARRDLADSGGTYTFEEVRRMLDLGSQAELDRLVTERSILVLQNGHEDRKFPVLQFRSDGSLLDGIGDVVKAVPTRNAWTILNFLVTSCSQLGQHKPIDLLKAGKVDLVLEAARRVGVHGA